MRFADYGMIGQQDQSLRAAMDRLALWFPGWEQLLEEIHLCRVECQGLLRDETLESQFCLGAMTRELVQDLGLVGSTKKASRQEELVRV